MFRFGVFLLAFLLAYKINWRMSPNYKRSTSHHMHLPAGSVSI